MDTIPESRLAPATGGGDVPPGARSSVFLPTGLLCLVLTAPVVHYFIWEHFIAQPRLRQAHENYLNAQNTASDARHRLELAKLTKNSAENDRSQAISIAQSMESSLASAQLEHNRKVGEIAASAIQRAQDAEEATRRAQAEGVIARKMAQDAQNSAVVQNQPERNVGIPQAVSNELSQFIDAYVAAQASNDINTHRPLYGDSVKYSYRKGMSTRQEVLMDFEPTIRRWPNRHYQIIPGGATAIRKAENEFQVKLSMAYQYSNGDKRTAGRTDVSMSVIKQDGAWRVVEWSEKVTK